jgi:dTMP kinase
MITTTTSAATPASTPPNNLKRRGAFILLEGVDRCGKTTQVGLLVKHLLSLSIATVAYRFPDRTTQGERGNDAYYLLCHNICFRVNVSNA